MRIVSFIGLAVFLASAAPLHAQTTIAAPPGWKSQARSGGATTFSPPDLRAGEAYSVTVYDSAPLGGKTLEEWLRDFAGPVSKTPGHLAAPLQIKATEGRIVSGVGAYNGPNGTQLGALFLGVSLDGGGNVHASRTLFSGQDGLLDRYKDAQGQLMSELVARAKAEAGSNLQSTPPAVLKHLTPGGELVPGVYAGNQYYGQELQFRFHLYLFDNGEYRLCDQNDEDITRRFFDEEVGNYGYNRNTGQLTVGYMYSMINSRFDGDTDFCYYGRDVNGKPAIYAEEDKGFNTSKTSLTYIGPAIKRVSQAQEKEQKAAVEAENNRFKWVTAPGKGVQNAQIAAILLDSKFNGQSADESVYLLLKDGTVYADLPVAPDELDIIRSRQREPDKWGKWRATRTGYAVSWNGAPFQNMAGFKVAPAPAQTKLQGRYGTGRSSGIIGMSSSYALWGVTFTKDGRFRKDRRGGSSSTFGFGDDATHVNSGYDDEGSFASGTGENFVVASERKKKNPNGAREGDYSLNGYVLTLRYDNGKVARLPFFFTGADQKGLWFEGASLFTDEKK